MTTEIITRVPDNFDSQPGDVLDNDGHVVIDGEVVDSDTADHSDTQGSQAQEYTSRGARALDIAAKRWESTVLKQRKIDEKLSDALDSGIDGVKKVGWLCIGVAGLTAIGIANRATKGLNAVGESANDLATGSGLAYEAVITKYNSARERRKARIAARREDAFREKSLRDTGKYSEALEEQLALEDARAQERAQEAQAAAKRREDAFREKSLRDTGKYSGALEEQLALEDARAQERAQEAAQKAQAANERKTKRKARRASDWATLKEIPGGVTAASLETFKKSDGGARAAKLGRSVLRFFRRTQASAQAARDKWQETA